MQDFLKSFFKFNATLVFILVSTFLIFFDQLIKFLVEGSFSVFDGFILIPGIFRLVYLKNYGAAFGIFFHKRLFLIIFTSCVLIFFTVFLIKFKIKIFYYLAAFSMLISGGVGNLIDRIFRGYVVDYCDLIFWPFENFAVFNLADCLTTVGCGMLFFKILFSKSDFESFFYKLSKR